MGTDNPWGRYGEELREEYGRNSRRSDEEEMKRLALQHGAGGSWDRHNLAQERVAGMQFGPGGSADRVATMHYGPGGAQDRLNLSSESINTATVGARDRATIAQAPEWAGQGAFQQSQARNTDTMTRFNESVMPDKVAAEKAKYAWNTSNLANLNPDGSEKIAKPRKYADWYKPGQFIVNPQEGMAAFHDQYDPSMGGIIKRLLRPNLDTSPRQ